MSGNPLGLGDDVLAAIDGVSLAEWAKFYQAAELKPLPKKAGYKFPSVDWQPYAWPRTGEELFDRPRAVRTPLEEAEHSGALPPRGEYETCSPPGVQNGTVSVSGWVVNRLGVPRVSSDIHTSEPSSSSWIQIPVRA